jgi:deoxycytidine triphosphate deaminase
VADRFAASEADARARFEKWHHTDPLPDVDPALLNSADIADYVAATGLIYPFDETALKPASYPMALGGKVLCWDNKTRERRVVTLKPGDEFELQPNAIAFVTLAPLLQLPDYLALRFNLRIQNVYRGLLLGTGPLIDPGFVGYLSFPLHNLTTNPYHFSAGEKVIWVEFTKLSRNESFAGDTSSAPARSGSYRHYAAASGRDDVEDYVREALSSTSSRHVWSSISEALNEAKTAVRRATLVNVGGGIALGAIGVSILGVAGVLFWNQWDLPRKGDVQRNERAIVQLRDEVADLRSQIRLLEAQRASAEKKP